MPIRHMSLGARNYKSVRVRVRVCYGCDESGRKGMYDRQRQDHKDHIHHIHRVSGGLMYTRPAENGSTMKGTFWIVMDVDKVRK
jgi:hypothetical protein